MNREILFRGKRLDNGEWIEVDAITQSDGRAFAIVGWDYAANKTPCNFYTIEVDPATIGQFTGMTDKNSKKIYEHDIIEDELDGLNDVVVYRENKFWLEPLNDDAIYWEKSNVIGNIHDNPELIK